MWKRRAEKKEAFAARMTANALILVRTRASGRPTAHLLGETLITMTLMTTITAAPPCRCEKAAVPMGTGKTMELVEIVMKILAPLAKEIGPVVVVVEPLLVVPPVPLLVTTATPVPLGTTVSTGTELAVVVLNPNGVAANGLPWVDGDTKSKANKGLKKSKPLGALKKNGEVLCV